MDRPAAHSRWSLPGSDLGRSPRGGDVLFHERHHFELGQLWDDCSVRIRVAFAAVVGAGLLAGCGSTPTAAPPSTTLPVMQVTGDYVPACAVVPQISQMIVHRSAISPGKFKFSEYSVVKDPMAARMVAKALCALPNQVGKADACPPDFGPNYYLSFPVARRDILTVYADPTGCGTTEGLGTERALNPHFWQVLGAALGLHPALRSSFIGPT